MILLHGLQKGGSRYLFLRAELSKQLPPNVAVRDESYTICPKCTVSVTPCIRCFYGTPITYIVPLYIEWAVNNQTSNISALQGN